MSAAIEFRYVTYGRGSTKRVRHIERDGRQALCGVTDEGRSRYYIAAEHVEALGIPVCKRCERAFA